MDLESIASRCKESKQLSTLSTFKVGGEARLFLEVHSIEEMQAALLLAKQRDLPFFILGKGSNCLFDDGGYDGLVIHNKISFCDFQWPCVTVGAGYSFSLLGVQTARQGWSGLEFASGIPASVGGAVYMNAGANGSETADSLVEVGFVDAEGTFSQLKREELAFSYRTSPFQKRKGAIVSAKFHLIPSDAARTKQLDIVAYRTRSQPYNDPSAGCVFRNPPMYSAGALIEQCGLKGKQIGGAEVSCKHANFIVNRENATARDVLALAEFVKSAVKEQTGIELEMEIRYVPR
ncbi:MAG: UDP-N-acetylmuramate dehydrogenase [Verrucomicrobia bacterium]|nr:UDP-N-acetylmuramate dehydrogenase [Verrucomicrobiota bacterium]